ncbi:MAG: hypothetical protein R3E08_04165 [Thiotrichaceae bacterium]
MAIHRAESQKNLIDSSTLTNLAYVIYTSGSTGKPGTSIAAVFRIFLLSMQRLFSLGLHDKFLAITTFHFIRYSLIRAIFCHSLAVIAKGYNREVATDGAQLIKLLPCKLP